MNEADTEFPEHSRPVRPLRALPGGHRELPHSDTAEEQLLSCIFIDPNDVLSRAEIIQLTSEAFYGQKRALVYSVAREMWRKNLPVTIATVAEELQTRGQLEEIGGYPFLLSLSQVTATTAEAGFFLEKVFEQGLVRAFIRNGQQTIEDGHNYTGGLDELLGKHASKLQRLADFALRRNRKPQREVAREARAYAQAAMAGTLDNSRVLPFGGLPHTTAAFLPFDVVEEDWLILIGALANVGKSMLARQHVAENLVAGRTWVVFLLETSRLRWLNGVAAYFTGVSARKESLAELRQLFPKKADEFDEWMAWLESLMEHQLWIFDDVFHLEDIERQVREINRRVRERQLAAAIAAGHPPELAEKMAYGLDGVMGDHLHLISTRKDFRGNREREVSHIGRTLKLLAKGLNVPNFWCAQLNRGSRNESRAPRMSDLRESGTLEQDADAVLLLHKPLENKASVKQTGDQSTHEIELIMAKRRNGPAGVSTDLLQHLKIGRFEELNKGAVARPGALKPAGGYKREGKQ